MSVKVKYHRNWNTVVKGEWTKAGLLEMVTDIHRRSAMLAPRGETSNLVNSGRIESIIGGYVITYGGGKVPYARRRHFENNKNPQTKRYLTRAADSVAREGKQKYFRNKI